LHTQPLPEENVTNSVSTSVAHKGWYKGGRDRRIRFSSRAGLETKKKADRANAMGNYRGGKRAGP